MATENEPAKLLLPYLQRADELQKHDPLVAYYLRLYAMERGLKIPQKERTKTTSALLVSLIKQLEKDKKSLTLGPDDHLHVEGFASNVFAKADKQDRAGKADINTAKTFYAASNFFEILNQFGEVQPDLEQKQKYAAWKAADIRKALKEGRKPLPGPPGGDEDLSVPSWTASGEQDLELSSKDSAMKYDPSGVNPTATIQPDSDVSPQLYNKHDLQHSTNISPQHSNIAPTSSPNISTPHHYPTDDNPSNTYHQPPSNHSENSLYSQSYNHQPYQPEPQPLVPKNYPSQNTYPNFQSYPSFTESSLPTAPSQYPSYYQGPDPSYSNLHPSYYQGLDASYPSVPPATTYSSSSQHDPVARNGNVLQASPPSAQKYEYDSSYEPPPEQIAEAQKAARFAVGALAFDDVFVAVDHLKKALELLTKPSAGH